MNGPDRSSQDRWHRHTVTAEEAGRTVREILRESMSISGRMIQRLTRSRGLSLNRGPIRLDRRVREGDVVAARIASAEKPTLTPAAVELDIVHEDGDLLVVEKPAGLLVHPTSARHDRTLAHGLAHHFLTHGVEAKVRPVHRLDRDTSGLLLVAKSAYAHQHLDRQLRDRSLTREYLALVEGTPEGDAGVVDGPIARVEGRPNLRQVGPGGEPALTRYRVVERFESTALLSLELDTGRTHQIRVHMAHIGHPIVGDKSYGGARRRGLDRIALHASAISFEHPRSGERLRFTSEVPAELIELVNRSDADLPS